RCIEIGDYVWFDLDNDGIQDSWENGINGLKVELYNNAGQLVAVTKTGRDPFSPSGDGYYHFCVAPGTYYVKYQRIFSLNPTQAKRGNDPQKDSDVTGRNGVNTTDKFSVTSGQSRLDIDVGFIYGFMMMGIVYQDDNENNTRDSGENGLDNLTLGL